MGEGIVRIVLVCKRCRGLGLCEAEAGDLLVAHGPKVLKPRH